MRRRPASLTVTMRRTPCGRRATCTARAPSPSLVTVVVEADELAHHRVEHADAVREVDAAKDRCGRLPRGRRGCSRVAEPSTVRIEAREARGKYALAACARWCSTRCARQAAPVSPRPRAAGHHRPRRGSEARHRERDRAMRARREESEPCEITRRGRRVRRPRGRRPSRDPRGLQAAADGLHGKAREVLLPVDAPSAIAQTTRRRRAAPRRRRRGRR